MHPIYAYSSIRTCIWKGASKQQQPGVVISWDWWMLFVCLQFALFSGLSLVSLLLVIVLDFLIVFQSLLLFPSSFKFAQFILEYSTYEKIHWTWSSPAKLKDSKLSTKRSAFSTMQATETKLQWRSKLLGQLTWCSLKLTLSPPLPLSPKQCWILNCTLWKHNHMVTIWFYQHCRKGERVCLLTLAKKWSLVRCFEVGCVFQKFPKNFSPQL